jgi:hypothetical protein
MHFVLGIGVANPDYFKSCNPLTARWIETTRSEGNDLLQLIRPILSWLDFALGQWRTILLSAAAAGFQRRELQEV